jgi:hypothetical protein
MPFFHAFEAMTMRKFSTLLGTFAILSTPACGDTSNPATGSGEASSGGIAESGSSSTTGGSATTATTAGSASADSTTGVATTMTSSNDDAPPPVGFDLGGLPDVPETPCSGGEGGGGGGGGGGAVELSYIWIANSYESPEGTISKIDTVTMEELGRYQAKPANGDPSRTSVNLDGDVVVANRNGGIAKFYAREADCQESNGMPGLQTSTGAADVLPWGEEECLAWYLPLACSSNRPVAWTRGEFSEASCTYENEKLWTACDGNVLLINGDSGEVEETIPVPSFSGGLVYGGAADSNNNFWGLDLYGGNGGSRLFRVDFETLEVLEWPLGPLQGYGIALDREGRPWTCGGGGASRFNLDDATWTTVGGQGIGGCMTDGEDTLWHSDPSGVLNGYDIESLELVNQIPLPEYVHGISIDFQGNVWGVSFAGNNAYRADPISGTVDTYAGLTQAYTYSDMTGFALSTAGGGGTPPN